MPADDLFDTILKVMFVMALFMLLAFIGSLTSMIILDMVKQCPLT